MVFKKDDNPKGFPSDLERNLDSLPEIRSDDLGKRNLVFPRRTCYINTTATKFSSHRRVLVQNLANFANNMFLVLTGIVEDIPRRAWCSFESDFNLLLQNPTRRLSKRRFFYFRLSWWLKRNPLVYIYIYIYIYIGKPFQGIDYDKEI